MKNIFIKTTLILMIGTIINKLLGFFIKIVATRYLGDSYYMYSLIIPTYSLLLTITQLGLPIAVSKVVSSSKYRSFKILSSIIPISLIINAIIIIIVIFFSPFLANNLLNNKDTYYPIIAMTAILPFTTISGIIKGYYFGKQNVTPNVVSNTIEQIARLIITITLIPVVLKINNIFAVVVYILINAITEIIQITIYLLYMPRGAKIKINDFIPDNKIVNEVFAISLPTLSSRLIGNICYFFEPIILTNTLIFVGYSSSFITTEYGVYNAYVIPLLTIFSFITLSLNTTLIPEISKNINNRIVVKKRLRTSLLLSLLLGIFTSIIMFFWGDYLLQLIYNTNKGITYLKFLSIFFFIFYLEGPLSSTLIALSYSKYIMKTTLISCIIKLIILFILSLFSIGIYGLIISEIINIYIVVILNMCKLKRLKYL